MIRQHFYPKNNIRRRRDNHKVIQQDRENLPPHSQLPQSQTIANKNCVFVEAQFTQPIDTQPMKKVYKRRHNSLLKPIYSVILYQNQRKSKKRTENSNFLVDSRRKQICSVVKRSISTVQKQKSEMPSSASKLSNFQFLDLDELDRKVGKRKKKERMPLSLRFKFNSPQTEVRLFEPKVKGWDTFADQFVDFT